MTRFTLLLLLVLAACSYAPQTAAPGYAGAQLTHAVEVPQASPVLETQTPEATAAPTRDFQATIDDLERQQLAATQTYEAGALLLAGYTATAAQYSRDGDYASQTAAPAAQEATREAESTLVAGVAMNATQAAAQRTATAQYPTQVVAAARSKAEADYGWLAHIGLFVVQVAAAILLLVLARSLWHRPASAPQPVDRNEADDPPAPLAPLGRPAIALPNGSIDVDTRPPSDETKFTAYALHAISGAALGINSVETVKIYTRAEYAPVLAWMQKKQYLAPQAGAVGLSAAGVEFCKLWIVGHPLPTGAEGPNSVNISHEHDNHEHDLSGAVADA